MDTQGSLPRLLLLCEGDPESWDSWSGTSRSVLTELRRLGHGVIPGDVDIYGIRRYLIGATQYSPKRRRWWVKYHLGNLPFKARSKEAENLVVKHRGEYDAILQFGATFSFEQQKSAPLFLYCDGNIALSAHARPSGQSEACFLSEKEVMSLKEREATVYAKASHIFTISDRLRTSFIEDFSISPDKVTTVYAGGNLPLADGMVANASPPPPPPTVLFVGRQFQRKGGDVLLQAFELVRKAIPDARLLLLGPRDVALDNPNVECLGFVNKDSPEGRQRIIDTYRKSHVFCMPTRYEGLSISFLEAMSFGLPCVSTYTDWARPEMIIDGETGLVVPMDDSAALAKALTNLLRSPATAHAMGQKGRDRLKSTFTWKRSVGIMSKQISNVFPGS